MSNSVVTFRPVRDIVSNMFEEMDRQFRGLGSETGLTAAWRPVVDISEEKDALRIHAELPGLRKEDIQLNVTNGVLSIQGERRFEEKRDERQYHHFERQYGFFARSFTLPRTVDTERIEASMKDGILEITIPKREEAKPKQISIR